MVPVFTGQRDTSKQASQETGDWSTCLFSRASKDGTRCVGAGPEEAKEGPCEELGRAFRKGEQQCKGQEPGTKSTGEQQKGPQYRAAWVRGTGGGVGRGRQGSGRRLTFYSGLLQGNGFREVTSGVPGLSETEPAFPERPVQVGALPRATPGPGLQEHRPN